MGSRKAVRTFSAQLFGERQGSTFVKGVASFVGPRPFEGSWQDSSFGIFTLQQNQDRITGKLGEGIYVDGQIIDQVANVRYRDPEGHNGYGFFAKTDSNLLVGLFWADGISEPKSVVAVQAIPRAAGKSGAAIPGPQDDAEARELKFLGYDLYSAQKYQAAALILEKVVSYFSIREALTTVPSLQANYLLEQAIPLQFLVLSANAAGDYIKLVDALALAIDVYRRKGKSVNEARDSYDFLYLQEHVEKTIEDFDEYSGKMSLLAESFEKGGKLLSAGGIGIRLEEKLNKAGIKVLRVSPEMPASQVGVVGGDVIIAVDAISIAGMTHGQVCELLQGEIGSAVSIRILRRSKTLEVSGIVRTPLVAASSKRRHELIQSFSGLNSILSQLHDNCLSDIEQLQQALLSVPDVSMVFKLLSVRLYQSIEALQEKRLSAITLAEKGLAESLLAIDLFRRFIIQMQAVKESGANPDAEMMARLLRLDEEIEAFDHNPAIHEFDKYFFKSASSAIAAFDQAILSLLSRLRLVKQSAKFAEEGVFEPSQTAEAMIGLSQFLDNWRTKLATDAAKISSLDNSQSFYNTYISTLIRMGLSEEALQASEAARARAFADLLAERYQATGDRDLSEDSFSYSSARPLSLKEIKQIVTVEKGTIIEYFLLPKHSHSAVEQAAEDFIAIWVMSPRVSTAEVSIRALQILVDLKALEADINRLVDLMAASLDTEGKRLEVAGLLRRLHSLLIEPLEREQLLSISAEVQETITIIPHSHLFSVPFAALLDENNRYLVEKYALNHATSISVLKYLQHNQTNVKPLGQRHLLALVNPDPLPKSEEDSDNRSLFPLLQTAKSFSKISDFYSSPEHCEVYRGAMATESLLRERAADADVLYFATHAEINANSPLSSFIALTKTTQHSGYFRASDASKLCLCAELVILAACETARGHLSSDGINGLSRAFTQAGASALLMSLWKVPEERTTLLMVGFHHHWLGKSQTKAIALQNTQKEFCKLENYRDQPNLWAGFILFGSSQL